MVNIVKMFNLFVIYTKPNNLWTLTNDIRLGMIKEKYEHITR